MSEPKCPACADLPLEELLERDVPFLGCTTCFGLWATTDDLAEYLVRATDQEPVREAFASLLQQALDGTVSQGKKRRCPRCEGYLQRLGFGERPFVILDRCAEGHGLWLDKKELKKVIRATRAHAAVLGLIDGFTDSSDDDEDEED